MTTHTGTSKITRDQALKVTAYCRRHKLNYVNQGAFPGTRKAAERANVRAPNGMLLHLPRNSSHNGKEWLNPRAYVLWKGEPLECIEEACAFIVMAYRQRTEIYVLRCSTASIDAELVEADADRTNADAQVVLDVIDSRE